MTRGPQHIVIASELLATMSPAERAQAWDTLYRKAGGHEEAMLPLPFDGRAQHVEGMNLIPVSALTPEEPSDV